MHGVDVTPVPAYGVRSTRDEATVNVEGSRGFRVKASFLAMHTVAAMFALVYLSVPVRVFLAMWGRNDADGLVVVALVALGFASISFYAVSSALTYFVAPMLRTEGGRLHWRRMFPARVAVFDARELVWRRGAGYVGPYLVTRRGRTERRIPIWMLPRARQRELFAWLDANVPPSRAAGSP